jgi:hypothetical protein
MANDSTHVGILMDRSARGLAAAADLLEECPKVRERMEKWRSSNAAYFVFITEQESRRIGSVTAEDTNALLFNVLPDLFESVLTPLASPIFAVAVGDAEFQTINQRVEQLTADILKRLKKRRAQQVIAVCELPAA